MKKQYRNVNKPLNSNLFSTKLNEVLIYRNLSNNELARLIGKSNGTISNWRHRKGIPSITDIKLIAEVTEIHISYFFNLSAGISSHDMRIKNKKLNESMDLFLNILFPDSDNFSVMRRDVSSKLLTLPEEVLPFIQQIVQLLQSDNINTAC